MTFPSNTAFSAQLPTLQLAWDSTSLGTLKECPYKYYLSLVLGWVPRATSVHLIFGQHYHKALERYDHSKAEGKSHEESLLDAVRQALEDTWERELQRPWVSDHPQKNRLTLVRTVIWYLEQFADDPLKTITLDSGKPAVELSWRVELPFIAPTDEYFMASGHLDRLVQMPDGNPAILDRKTTTSSLGPDFVNKFTPDNQFSMYCFAGQVVYRQPTKFLIVDGAQIGVNFSRFERGIVQRPSAVISEWLQSFGVWLGSAAVYAQSNFWPQNDKSCNNYGGCPYRSVCSLSPAAREGWLRGSFQRRIWDPLIVRGDV